MKRKEDLLSLDFQGWPVYRMNFRELLESLGAEVHDGVIGFDAGNPILSAYPLLLADGGMGYGGGSERWIVSGDREVYESKEEPGVKVFNVWRDVRDPRIKKEMKARMSKRNDGEPEV